jgi:hypothetical protein
MEIISILLAGFEDIHKKRKISFGRALQDTNKALLLFSPNL